MIEIFATVRSGLYNPEDGRLIERGKVQASALGRELNQRLGGRVPLIFFSAPVIERRQGERLQITASRETAAVIARQFGMSIADCYKLPRGREDQLRRVVDYIIRRTKIRGRKAAVTVTREERAMSLMAGMINVLLGENKAIMAPANGQALLLTCQSGEVELLAPRMTVLA